MSRLVVAMFPIVLLTSPVLAADAANGKRLAERWCAACHIVDVQQQRGTTQAPPFSEAAKRHMDAPALALFLLNPHPKMPDMNLSRTEASDIAAYIVSLR